MPREPEAKIESPGTLAGKRTPDRVKQVRRRLSEGQSYE